MVQFGPIYVQKGETSYFIFKPKKTQSNRYPGMKYDQNSTTLPPMTILSKFVDFNVYIIASISQTHLMAFQHVVCILKENSDYIF